MLQEARVGAGSLLKCIVFHSFWERAHVCFSALKYRFAAVAVSAV